MLLPLIKERRRLASTSACSRVRESRAHNTHIHKTICIRHGAEANKRRGAQVFLFLPAVHADAISGAGLANSPERTGARCEFAWNVGTIEIIIIRPAVRSRRRTRERENKRRRDRRKRPRITIGERFASASLLMLCARVQGRCGTRKGKARDYKRISFSTRNTQGCLKYGPQCHSAWYILNISDLKKLFLH